MDLFADYQEDAWPSPEQVSDLPPSRTGLGLDQPLSAVKAAVVTMDQSNLEQILGRFCSSWPGPEDQACECGAMGRTEGSVNWRRVDAHVTAEDLAAKRLAAAWGLHHHGQGWIDGHPAERYLEWVLVYG